MNHLNNTTSKHMEKNNMNVCEVTVKFHLKDGNSQLPTLIEIILGTPFDARVCPNLRKNI